MGSSSLPEALGSWASPGAAGSLWATWPEAISSLRKEALWRQGAGAQKALAQPPRPRPSQASGCCNLGLIPSCRVVHGAHEQQRMGPGDSAVGFRSHPQPFPLPLKLGWEYPTGGLHRGRGAPGGPPGSGTSCVLGPL